MPTRLRTRKLSCPAHLDPDGGARCGLPAEVVRRFTMHSTDGPLEAAMIRCPVDHWFNGPIETLTRNSTHPDDPAIARRGHRSGRERLQNDTPAVVGEPAASSGFQCGSVAHATSQPLTLVQFRLDADGDDRVEGGVAR